MTDFIFMIFESINWPVALIIGFSLLFLHGAVLTPPSELSLAALGLYASLYEWLFFPAVFAATAGNLAGSTVLFRLSNRYTERVTNFIMSGRLKYVRYILKIARSEFYRHGHLFVLYGRFIPNIRSVVTVPAGISGMRLSTFMIYSGIGFLSWSLIWISIGYFAGRPLLNIIETHKTFAFALLVLMIIGLFGHRYYILNRSSGIH